MARTEHGDPGSYTRQASRFRNIPDYEDEKLQYQKMEDDYIRDMTVKPPGQYSGDDYDKAIEKMRDGR